MSTYVPKSQRKAQKIAGIFGTSVKKVNKSSSFLKEDNVPDFFKEKTQNYDKFPNSLKNYVQKCFAQCSTDENRKYVSDKLVDKISSIMAQGLVLSHNWAGENTIPLKEQDEPQNSWLKLFKIQKKQNSESKFEEKKEKEEPAKLKVTFKTKKQGLMKLLEDSDDDDEKEPPQVKNEGKEYLFAEEKEDENKEDEEKVDFQLTKSSLKAAKKKQKQEQKKKAAELLAKKKEEEELLAKKQAAAEAITKKKEASSPITAAFSPSQVIKKVPKVAPTLPVIPKIPKKTKQEKTMESMLDVSLEELTKLSKLSKKGKKQKKKDSEISTSFINPQRKRQLSRDMSFEEIVEENKIVGTCQNLEKEYLRLTNVEPEPSLFRPPEVLKKSLEFCLDKFHKTRNYEYIRDQLRSIRQDLIVQDIEDEFSVLVYETVARLAIEHFDWDNFNQSLNPLESFYAQGLGKKENIAEISAYKIMYLVGFKDKTGLYSFIPKLDEETLASSAVQFAIEAWKAVDGCPWSKFFKMLNEATPLMKNVMGISVPSLRFGILGKIQKAFRNLSLEEYKEMLFFDTLDETKKYLDDNEIPVPIK